MMTAIIPAAGRGSRLGPITSAIPKELVPVYDTVALFNVCEEAARAGIDRIILVNSPDKPSLIDIVVGHFDRISGETGSTGGPEIYEVLQPEPFGLGHAVACARDLVDQYPVMVLLPDILFDGPTDLLDRMKRVAANDRTVICVQTARPPRLNRCGVIEFDGPVSDGMVVRNLVEKPDPGSEPSDQMVVGRYWLSEDVIAAIFGAHPGLTGEIELTDAIAAQARSKPGSVVACVVREEFQDTGTFDGLLLANLSRFARGRAGSPVAIAAARLIAELTREIGINRY
jgi:UTP--glucose-1-phosphate uridylyltransferase